MRFDEEPQNSLLVTDEDFAEYFLGVLNLSAFVLGQLRYSSKCTKKKEPR
jgi:hypothetical protein